MNDKKNVTYYGMFVMSIEEFFMGITWNNDMEELKKLFIHRANGLSVKILMYVQRYNFDPHLINKKAMCALSFNYAGKVIYYCGTLKATEKTFRAMQKAVEKHCIR